MKMCLMQHGRVVKTKKTETVKKTTSPAFNESFTFKISAADIDGTSLSVIAMQCAPGQRGEYF